MTNRPFTLATAALAFVGLALAATPKVNEQPIGNLIITEGQNTMKIVLKAVVNEKDKAKVASIILYADTLRGFSVTLKDGRVELFQLRNGKIFSVPHKSAASKKTK